MEHQFDDFYVDDDGVIVDAGEMRTVPVDSDLKRLARSLREIEQKSALAEAEYKEEAGRLKEYRQARLDREENTRSSILRYAQTLLDLREQTSSVHDGLGKFFRKKGSPKLNSERYDAATPEAQEQLQAIVGETYIARKVELKPAATEIRMVITPGHKKFDPDLATKLQSHFSVVKGEEHLTFKGEA